MNLYLLLFFFFFDPSSAAIVVDKVEQPPRPDRKTPLSPMMPIYMTSLPNFQTQPLGAVDPTAGAHANAFPNMQPSNATFQDQLNMLYHPLNPFSPLNPVNMLASNPMINPLSPVHGLRNMPLAGTQGGVGLGQDTPSIGYIGHGSDFESSLKRSAFPEFELQDKCMKTKARAITIANKILQRQNAVVFKEIMNYILKSKFLLGMTEVKLSRTLKRKMLGLLKQYSSLTEDNVQFIDSKYTELIDNGLPEEDLDFKEIDLPDDQQGLLETAAAEPHDDDDHDHDHDHDHDRSGLRAFK